MADIYIEMKKGIETINYLVFPFIFAFALFVSILESYKYMGFFQAHFHISSFFIYLLSIFSWLGLVISKIKLKIMSKSSLMQWYLIGGVVIFVIILSLYIILNELEIIYYDNYSFAHFHFQPVNLIYPLILSTESVILIFITNNNLNSLRGKAKSFLKIKLSYPRKIFVNSRKQINIWLAVSWLLFFVFGFYNFFISVRTFVKSDTFILSHLDASYDKKMEQKWGTLYYLVELILRNTPENSKILFPPKMAPWLVAGNINQVRYFLGNRILYNANDPISIEGNPDYILIAQGGLHPVYDAVKDASEYDWPKVFIPAQKIWYADPALGRLSEVDKDFDPKDSMNKNAWGLIKVDKKRI